MRKKNTHAISKNQFLYPDKLFIFFLYLNSMMLQMKAYMKYKISSTKNIEIGDNQGLGEGLL